MDRAHTTSYAFDDRNIQWGPIEVPGCGVLPHFEFAPLAGSMEFKVVDFLIKFPPKQEVNGRVVNLIHAHRHCGITNLFVIAGEHHIYEPDGTLREVRPVGNSPSPHRVTFIQNVGDLRGVWCTTACVAVACCSSSSMTRCRSWAGSRWRTSLLHVGSKQKPGAESNNHAPFPSATES